jgi:hypothetical protein
MSTNSQSEAAHRVDECLDLLVELGLGRVEELLGATHEDLALVAHRYPSMPAAYRRYLERAGRGAGHFLQGSNLRLPEIVEYRDALAEMVTSSTTDWSLAASDIVFLSHQGYTFLFLGRDDDDPPVLSYCEGDARPKVVSNRFTDWLCAAIREDAAGQDPRRKGRCRA